MIEKKNKEKMTDNEKASALDKVLSQFKVFGRYHSVHMFWTMLSLATNTLYCVNFVFVTEEVGYRCVDEEFSNVTCRGSNTTQQCTEWIYDNPDSFVAEFGLACQEWKRTLVGTAHSAGYMIGLLLMGPMSDSAYGYSIVENPTVHTNVGSIRGLRASDGDYSLYLGIPYATVDENNPFGVSIPVTSFTGVFDAYQESAACPQINATSKTVFGDLNCLSLNVYVPNTANHKKLVPVMVWIYGGGFYKGYAGRHDYGPKFLMRQDVILVTINYRVGPYGFMCLDVPEVPGNQGLKDQVIAFKWIKDNIEAFGGDVNKMTLFGQSAGAQSVDLYLLSRNDNIFNNVIMESGSSLAATLLYEPDKSAPIAMAAYFDFKTDSVHAALRFLSSKDSNSVIDAATATNIMFKPCVENDIDGVDNFITTPWINASMPKVNGLPILIGSNNKERYSVYENYIPGYFKNLNVINELLNRTFNFNDDFLAEMESIIYHFYLGDHETTDEIRESLGMFDSDYTYIHPIQRSIAKFIKNSAKVYYYIFSYYGGRNLAQYSLNYTIVGALHNDELRYIFDPSHMIEEPSPEDQIIIDQITTMWANFAKYRLGRKLAIVISGVLGGVIGVARSFTTWYWLFIALEFLEGAIGDNCSPTFILTVEIVSTKNRLLYYLLCAFGYPFGGVLLSLGAWMFPYWRTLLRVLYSPALLFFIYLYVIDESPRWLLSKGKKEEAVKIIEEAAKRNKIKVDKSTLEKIEYVKEKGVNFFDLLKITFSSRIILKRFLVCVVWWTTSTFVNYGLSINSVSLQGNKYVNFALTCLMDVPSSLIILFSSNYFKRKTPLIASFMAVAVLCVAHPFLPTNLSGLSLILYMVGKLMSSIYFTITYMYTSELFPTYTRNSMHALCSSLGRIGSIVAPQTPLLLLYWYGLPSLVFGGMSLLAGFITFLVPDTADDSLPDTVHQAEELGKPKDIPERLKTPVMSFGISRDDTDCARL